MNKESVELLKTTLTNCFITYRVDAEIVDIRDTPLSLIFVVRLGPKVSVSKIKSIQSSIQMELGAKKIELLIPMPGTSDVGIKVLKEYAESKQLFSIFKTDEYKELSASKKFVLPYVIGIDDNGNTVIGDLTVGRHLLIGGTTGSGKSVFLNSIIACMFRQSFKTEIKLLLIDTAGINFMNYNGLSQLILPVITDRQKALGALSWLYKELMTRRQEIYCKSIEEYNRINRTNVSHIIAIIDDFADLVEDEMFSESIRKTVEDIISFGNNVGIHLVISTQRPTVQFVSRYVKHMISDKISFAVASKADSRIVLDTDGAELLNSSGELLFKGKNHPTMVHCISPYLSDEQILNMTEKLKQRYL